MNPIYLDHNATTPLLPQAAEAMVRCYVAGAGNAASQHAAGRQARKRLEAARESIGRILGANVDSSRGDRLIFTSGGTESNNLALFGLAGDAPAHAVISAIEHPSVAAAAAQLQARGWMIDRLPVSPEGVMRVEQLGGLLRDETRMVSLMLGNNETGVLQPVARAAEICAARGVPLHCDAVQAVGKVPVDFRALGVAALSASAHKFHGPQGIGVLVIRHDVTLAPMMHGGFQQAGLRPGTEPVALAVGMQAALEHWHGHHDALAAQLATLRDRFEAQLQQAWPALVIHGSTAQRLPHVSNVAFPGLDRQALVMALDLAGIACSTGSACASGSAEPSPTLIAMGCEKGVVQGSLRFSLGYQTTVDEVDEAVRRILKICKQLEGAQMPGKMPFGGRSQGAILLE